MLIKKILKITTIIALLIVYVYICSIISIPNSIVLFEGENLNLKIAKGLTLDLESNYETILTSTSIGNQISSNVGTSNLNLNLFGTITLKKVNVDVIPKTTVIPLGTAIGMKLYTKGVLVVGMSQIDTENSKKEKPYENSGIEEGDAIIEVNGTSIQKTDDLIEQVNKSNGKEIKIKYVRNEQTLETSITPVKSKDEYKIGLWVRDTQAGVGTATFYEPSTNMFMTLGHGITDIDTGKVVDIAKGELITANIASIVKGQKGNPGEIKGTIDSGYTIGNIQNNTCFGVYGTVTNKNYLNLDISNAMSVANRDEIQEGKAEIICQLDNTGSKKYTIEIEKVFINNSENNKSMLIKVTDSELLEKTGGIIQGMSGSPIIQNDKFIGAVTNVLVNDPTQGYAVFGDILIKQLRSVEYE